MSKTPSAQKKKIKLTQPSNEVESVYNRLLDTSFGQTYQSSQTEPSSLFQEIKFPPHKVRSLEGEFERLGEITDRCISYKQRFLENYRSQVPIFEEVLATEKEYVITSCERFVKKVYEKRDQLIEDLIAKEYEVRLYWESSLNELESHLLLISKTNMENTQLSQLNRQEFDGKLEDFTNLVSTFYRKIRVLEVKLTEDLDKSQFEEVHNEAKLLAETKLLSPRRMSENKSFTFNEINPNESLNVPQKLNQILKAQSARDGKIQAYKENIMRA